MFIVYFTPTTYLFTAVAAVSLKIHKLSPYMCEHAAASVLFRDLKGKWKIALLFKQFNLLRFQHSCFHFSLSRVRVCVSALETVSSKE